jgi:hypothetical protein
MRPGAAAAALLTASLIAAGCGGSGSGASGAERADTAPAAPARAFPAVPSGGGQGIEKVLSRANAGGPQLAPSVSVLKPGENRIGFGLFRSNGNMVRESVVALYVARADGTHPAGPFPARRESLKTDAPYRSKQAATDATPYVYVALATFPRPGRYGMVAVVKHGSRLLASAPIDITVGRAGAGPPDVGQQAPKMTTLTPDDVGGDLSKLTTRQPALRSLVDTNFADVLGRKPVVLGFATPQLCQSRVCGPVVDVMAQLQAKYGSRVAFIQQEIYVDNTVSKGLRPQLATYRLQTEPWIYVIDARGKIAARFEGALSVEELDAAVAGVAP